MDELQALRELRRDVEPASPRRMAELRAGLFRTIATPPPPPRRSRMPKLVWRTALAGGLAVAMLAGITVAQGRWFQPDTASAAVFLENAARAVEHRPSHTQRPGDRDWLYTKEMTSSVTYEEYDSTVRYPATPRPGATPTFAPDDTKFAPDESKRRVEIRTGEGWFRFDGKEMASYEHGKLLQGPIDMSGYDERYPAQVWDVHASLPLESEALLAALHEEVRRIYPDDPEFWHGRMLDNRTVWLIGTLLGEDVGLLPRPELQAALYRALARIPGVRITENVTDLAGRKGVLLSQVTSDFRSTILLEPGTYNYLGSANRIENGKVVEGTSLLRSGMVGKAGERP